MAIACQNNQLLMGGFLEELVSGLSHCLVPQSLRLIEVIEIFEICLTAVQGKDISKMLDDPKHEVRDAAFCVAPMRKGFLLREDRYAYIQYGEDASGGIELFDSQTDPKQYTNLAASPEHKPLVARLKAKMQAKLKEVRDNDLPKRKQRGKR